MQAVIRERAEGSVRKPMSRAARPEPTARAAPVRLLDHLGSSKAVLGRRAREVTRLWLSGGDERGNLRHIDRTHGVGARRVRHVVAATLKSLDERTGCLAAVDAGLRDFRDRLPLPVEEIPGQGWAQGLARDAVLWLARERAGVHRIRVPGAADALAPVDPGLWDRVMDAAGLACAGQRPDGPAPDAAIGALAGMVLDPEAHSACERCLAFLLEGRTNLSVALASGREECVVDAVLPPGGRPIRFPEIEARLERLAPGQVTPSRLRQLVEAGSVEPVPGHHASPRGSGLAEPVMQALAAQCVSVASRRPAKRTWTTSGLLAALRAAGAAMPEGLDVLGLERTLVEQGALHRHRPMAWSLAPRRKGRRGLATRVAERVLQRNGKPMTRQAIQAAVREAGGGELPDGSWVSGRLIELAGDRWGLVDRDLSLTPAECRLAFEAVSRMLNGATALSLASIRASLEAGPLAGRLPDLVALRYLLNVHGGFFVGARGHVRWRMARKPVRGVAKRIVDVLAAHPDGIRVPDLVSAVGALGDGVPSDAIVKNTLWRYARRESGDPSLWRLLAEVEVRPRMRSVLTGAPSRERRHTPPGARRHAYPAIRKPAKAVAGFDWTPDRVDVLVRLAAEGAGSTRIVEALGGGLSRNAVISKARRLGVTVGG